MSLEKKYSRPGKVGQRQIFGGVAHRRGDTACKPAQINSMFWRWFRQDKLISRRLNDEAL